MTQIRVVFLETVDATVRLLADPALVDRFDGPSALAEFAVRGLAGHLLRAMTSAEGYLAGPEPDAGSGSGVEVISAPAYYAAVAANDPDLDSDFHQAIRRRGVEAAPDKAQELAGLWAETADRLRALLTAAPAGRLVQVYGNLVLTLDDYLITRLIELVVHADDLAVSLDIAPPPLPAAATGLAIATLVEVARIRHGDTAVLRALARRERDAVAALRVL